MKSFCFVVVATLLVIFVSPASSQDDSDVYNKIGTIKGHVQWLNNRDLGKTPANGMYIVFQRVGCRKCLVGTHADIDGNYKVFLGLGRYKLIIFKPSPPVYDLLAPDQPRFVNVSDTLRDTVFDINLKTKN